MDYVRFGSKADMPPTSVTPPKSERPRQDRDEAAGAALLSDHAAYLV
jgi:hypothetical protein